MTYKMIDDIPVFGEPLENAVDQLKAVKHMAEHCALMADHHHGYDVPIGSVMAYDGKISPAGVGFDIACGNKAVRLDLPYYNIGKEYEDASFSDSTKTIEIVMDAIWKQISFGPGGTNKHEVDDQGLMDKDIWNEKFMKNVNKKKTAAQLGTIGGGNHYIDIFVEMKEGRDMPDYDAPVWIGVHFGSRGLGHTLAKQFMNIAGKEPNALLDITKPAGSDYLSAMLFAGTYAAVGRNWVCAKVAEIMGAEIVEEVHNHHNFAWVEQHFGRYLWVVRKGATPCFPGQKSFVGSTMGDISYILEGKESEDSEVAMYSTIHGAGRIMSRTEAAGKVKRGRGRKGKDRVVKEGKITRKMMLDYVWGNDIELRGAGTDEAPQAYKRLDEVLKYHENTVRIKNRLRPIGVAMASSGRRD